MISQGFASVGPLGGISLNEDDHRHHHRRHHPRSDDYGLRPIRMADRGVLRWPPKKIQDFPQIAGVISRPQTRKVFILSNLENITLLHGTCLKLHVLKVVSVRPFRLRRADLLGELTALARVSAAGSVEVVAKDEPVAAVEVAELFLRLVGAGITPTTSVFVRSKSLELKCAIYQNI